MNKINCEDLKLSIKIDDEDIDLSPFFLKYPLFINSDKEKTYMMYFSKEKVVKVFLDMPMEGVEPVLVESEDTCLSDVNKDVLIKLLSNNKGFYPAKALIELIDSNIKLRFSLIDRYRELLFNSIESKDEISIAENIKILTTLTTCNTADLLGLQEIVGEELDNLLEINDKYIELVQEIINKINDELKLNISNVKKYIAKLN